MKRFRKNIQYIILLLIVSFFSKMSNAQDWNLSVTNLTVSTYFWTNSNGFTSNLQNPMINNLTVANSGVYQVTILTPSCGTPNTAQVTIKVNEYATIFDITVDESGLKSCIGESTDIIVESTGVTNPQYVWYDNQNNGISNSVSNVYTTPVLSENATYCVSVYKDTEQWLLEY